MMVTRALITVAACGLGLASLPVTVAEPPEASAPPAGWSWSPVLPRAKSAFATASDGKAIFTVGGAWWGTGDDGEPKKLFTADVLQLHPGRGGWSRLPDFPQPIGYGLTICLNGRLLVAGGTGADGQPLRETWELDPADPTAGWRRGPDLPWPATRLRGGVIGDRVFALVDPEAADPDAPQVVLERDPQGHWTVATEAPGAATRYRAAVAGGDELLLFGGGSDAAGGGIDLHDGAFAWNPRKPRKPRDTRKSDDESWRRLATLPIPMRDVSLTRLDDRRILIAGGVEQAADGATTPDGQDRIILSNRCWVYDIVEDRYESAPSLPLAVADHGLVTCGSQVYAVAGEDSVYRTRTDLVQQVQSSALRPE